MSLKERKEISEYIVDETVIKAGSENIWLWVSTEPENGQFLALFDKPYQKRETCLLLKGFYQTL